MTTISIPRNSEMTWLPSPCDLYSGAVAAAMEGLIMDSSMTTSLKQGVATIIISIVSRWLEESTFSAAADAKGTLNKTGYARAYINMEYVYALILGSAVHKLQYGKASLKSCVMNGLAISFYDYAGDLICGNFSGISQWR